MKSLIPARLAHSCASLVTLLAIFALLVGGTLAAAPQIPVQQFGGEQQPQRVRALQRPQGVVGGVQLGQQPVNRIQLQIMPSGGVQNGGGLTFPQDRTTLRNLRLAQQMVSEQNYTDAAALLGAILAREEDFFFQPDEGTETHTSIKAEVRRMIGDLPPEGREAFQLRFGDEATAMLKTAIADQDTDALTKVAATYFHTQAGYDATYLLGQHRLDHGQPLAAGLAFGQLASIPQAARARYEPGLSLQAAMAWSQAGMQANAIAALNKLREEQPGAMLDLGGQRVPLPANESQLAAWLANIAPSAIGTLTSTDQWTMFRGDPARNAQAAGGMPILNKQWESYAADDVQRIEAMLSQMQRRNAQAETPRLPTLHPICVNGTYVFRSPIELVAVDAQTGKRLWNGAQDSGMRKLLAATDGSVPLQESRQPRNPQDAQQVLDQTLAQRTWGDLTYGTISSDGRNVYCVEELPVGGSNIEQLARAGIWVANPFEVPGTLPQATNRLRAYGLANQGKLMREWPLGLEDDPLEGAFFLGPPLPLGDTLYVLAELGGEQNNGSLALVAIDPNVAPEQSVLWVQTLGVVEQSLMLNPLRRTGGFTPSFAEGVLVCPTGNGALVGFDLMSRSLLWGYDYAQKQDVAATNPRNRIRVLGGRNINVPQNGGANLTDGWADNSVTIVDGKVICGPQDSDQLHCLDLLTGKPAWGEAEVERQDSRYVAGVVDDTVLLVGLRGVRAVDLETGDMLWSHQLPDQRFPAGRGFFHGVQYHLPLSVTDLAGDVNGEIAIVDVSRRSLHVPEEQRERPAHVALGNLICYDGAIFSQNALGAQRYDRYEDLMQRVAAQLESNPRDVSALLQQAALFQHEGRFAEAVDKLRLAHEIAHSEQTRQRLLSILLDGLATDFNTYRQDRQLIEQLVKSDEDRARLYRTMGHQLELAGELEAAFVAYVQLSEIDPRAVPLHSLSMEWLVRPDRWLRSRTAELYSSATEAERAAMDAALAGQLAYQAGESVADLRRLLDYFGNLPAADDMRRRLVTQLLAQPEPAFVEIETLLHELKRSDNPTVVRFATADLAELYSQVYVTYAARPYLELLKSQYTEETVRDQMSGAQFAEFLADEHVIRPPLAYEYPAGKIHVQEVAPVAPVPRTYAVPVVEAQGSLVESMQFRIEDEQKIQGFNDFGKLLWETQLSEDNVLLRMCQGGQRLGAYEHLVIVWTGNHLVGIDALGDDKGGNGREIRWVQPLVGKMGEVVNPRFQIQSDSVGTPWGEQRLVYNTQAGQKHGSRPVIFGKQVVALRQGELVAFDAISGAELWVRRGIPSDSDIFGDDEFVFLATGENLSARAFDAVTGEELPGVAVPPRSDRIAYRGRRIVHWDSNGANIELGLLDPVSGKSDWTQKAPRRVKLRVIEDTNELISLDEEGVLQVHSLVDGDLKLKTRVASVPKGPLLTVFVDSDRYYVGVSQEDPPQDDGAWLAPPILTPVHRKDASLIFGKLLALDRKTGKLVWEHEVQGFSMIPDQPQGGPELVLAGAWTARRRRNTSWGRTGIAVLDKRDGQILMSDAVDSVDAMENFRISKNPAKKELRLESSGRAARLSVYQLNWTDAEAIEPDPELKLILRPSDND